MTRVLIRSGKDPFTVLSPEATLRDNVLGTNSGNLIFAHAVWKALSRTENTITSSYYRAEPADAGRINEQYDVFVVPLANAFRKSFIPQLDKLTALIRKLRIPVVVVGVGAQSDLSYDRERMSVLDGSVTAFCRAVLDRSASIGVRGEFTFDYLTGLGFTDVDVIGCPSMFLYADRLEITRKDPRLDRHAALGINVSPYLGSPLGNVMSRHADLFPNAVYVPQDTETLDLLLWGEPHPLAGGDVAMPVHPGHRLLRENRVRFFVDPLPWLQFMATRAFVVGSRIHGTIMALLAGTPAHLFVHDSRTLELARYHRIPHSPADAVDLATDATDLFASTDYSAMERGHPQTFAVFRTFLERNGLKHNFGDLAAREAFEAKLAAAAFPPGVDNVAIGASEATLDRLRFLRREQRNTAGSTDKRLRQMKKRVDALQELVAGLIKNA